LQRRILTQADGKGSDRMSATRAVQKTRATSRPPLLLQTSKLLVAEQKSSGDSHVVIIRSAIGTQ
jgi:hypothetical protein